MKIVDLRGFESRKGEISIIGGIRGGNTIGSGYVGIFAVVGVLCGGVR